MFLAFFIVLFMDQVDSDRSTPQMTTLTSSHAVGDRKQIQGKDGLMVSKEDLENKKVRKQELSYLPTEIVSEILSWVPLKSMLDCRRVSKAWLASTLIPGFTNIHALRAPKSVSFIAYKCNKFGEYEHVIFNVPSGTEVPLGVAKNDVVHSSCNGLVCVERKQGNFYYVGNPITRQYLVLPACEHKRGEQIGFGFIPGIQAYKVIRIYAEGELPDCYCSVEICTVGMDTRWRKLDCHIPIKVGLKPCPFPSPIQVGGALYWVNDVDWKRAALFSLDLESEQLSTQAMCRNSLLLSRNSFLFDCLGNLACLGFFPPHMSLHVLNGDAWTWKGSISFDKLSWDINKETWFLTHPIIYKDNKLFLPHYIEQAGSGRSPVVLTVYDIVTGKSNKLYRPDAKYLYPHTNTVASCPGMHTSEVDRRLRKRYEQA